MSEGYEIVEHETEGGNPILVLRPIGSKDFLERMRDKPKQRDHYKLIVRMVARVQYDGPKRYIGKLIRLLDSELSLYELKVGGRVIRVMAYIYQPYGSHRVVLLFDFDGHQGSGKIPPEMMEKARKLARIARETLEEGIKDGIR